MNRVKHNDIRNYELKSILSNRETPTSSRRMTGSGLQTKPDVLYNLFLIVQMN